MNYPEQRMEAGGVVREAWEMYKTHWRHLLPIALVVYLLLSFFALLLASLLGWLGVIAGAFVSLAGIFWLQGALVVAIEDVRDGRTDLSIRETLSRVRPRMNTLAAAGVLAALAITLGLILFIVPGLLLFTWWLLIVPVIVLEGAGVTRAFGRSRELVRGNGWNVFGVIVLTFLVLVVAGIVLGLALSFLPDELATYIGDVVSNTLTAPFVALAWTLVYYRLAGRDRPAEPAAESPFASPPGQ